MYKPVSKIVIAGGGTAGWIAASALTKQLGPLIDVVLIESDEIGTVGVGEASIPTMRTFHRLAGVDEQDFMRATQSTFKLGISFENWGQQGDRYIHSFGAVGKRTWMAEFHNIWLHARSLGLAGEIGSYCLELQAALVNKFAAGNEAQLNYAYHLDASLYANYLRRLTEARGLKRIEGRIVHVEQNSHTGFIEALVLENGLRVVGDLFIDCTGFRGLLIEQTLSSGFEEWGQHLPMNRAVAVQTTRIGEIPVFTRSMAGKADWQWRIPLQNRMGNGIVFCSDYLSEDEARQQLLDSIEGEMLTEPKLIKFTTGRRKKVWNKNCVALGLASGFLEPLESTSIHLIMIGVTRLMQFFPFSGCTSTLQDHFNDASMLELERIRDFIILHYKLNKREDSRFWVDRKHQEIPDSLAARVQAFIENGLIYPADGDLFRVDSWLQVMLGQGLVPKTYHQLGRLMTEDQLKSSLENLSQKILKSVSALPRHSDFIARYCAATESLRSS